MCHYDEYYDKKSADSWVIGQQLLVVTEIVMYSMSTSQSVIWTGHVKDYMIYQY